MNLEKDFVDFISLLNKHDVEYLVVGGYALGFHGMPRTTGDMDIWINRTEENVEKVVQVIDEFGFSFMGLTTEDLLEKGIITQFGYPPLRIDILNEIDGIEFSEAIQDRQIFTAHELSIAFIGVKDFIKNKEATGRAKDIQDLKAMQKNIKSARKNPGLKSKRP